MGIATGYTADHMDAIQAACIVSGAVSGDDLVLTKYDGSTVDAGNVRGPQGIKGDTGATGAQGPGNATDAQVSSLIGTAGNASRTAVANLILGSLTNLGNITGTVSLSTPLSAAAAINGTVKGTLTGNVTFNTATMPVVSAGTKFRMFLTQDATGGRRLTLTGFKIVGGLLALSYQAGATDPIEFFYDGANWWVDLLSRNALMYDYGAAVDCNTVTATGRYFIRSGSTNSPNSAAYYALEVDGDPTVIGGTNNCTQTARRLGGSVTNREVWFRHLTASNWSGWIKIGGDPTWTNLTFPSGYSAQTFGYTPQWHVDGSGHVHLRGVVRNTAGAAIASGTTIAYLPAGYYPSEDVEFSTAATNSAGLASSSLRIELQANDNPISINFASGSPTWASLDPVHYWLT